jgi:prepilin-type N-terminal cleavage/methylation domain-containing protein
MAHCKPKVRSGFTLIELLVVLLIIMVLLGIMLPAIQQFRQATIRVQCMNNLHNIGIAMHNYQSSCEFFPRGCSGASSSSRTFYWAIRNHIEADLNDGDRPVPAFLCPGRRTVATVNGPYADYGYAVFGT